MAEHAMLRACMLSYTGAVIPEPAPRFFPMTVGALVAFSFSCAAACRAFAMKSPSSSVSATRTPTSLGLQYTLQSSRQPCCSTPVAMTKICSIWHAVLSLHTCTAVICLLARLHSRCPRRRLLASTDVRTSVCCAGQSVWLVCLCAAVDGRLRVLRVLCGRVLPSGAGGSGPGHIGPLTVHMGVRSIAMSSSYRRMMHGWIQIAARELQMTQQGI